MYKENLLTHNWLMKRRLNRSIGPLLKSLSGTVIDLGCGTRPFREDILVHASGYVGVDWGNSLHGANPDVLADLNRSLPFADSSVDNVVSFEVLEHVADPAAMLEEVHRMLRPGGMLLLSTPFQWWIHEAPWDYYRYTRYGLEHLLQKAGFSNIEINPTTGFWTTWILKLNYQLARLVTGGKTRRLFWQVVLLPVWWLGQCAAEALDRRWGDERETAGYVARASR